MTKTEPFTQEKVFDVLKKLKNNKSRDSLGFINEIFKPEVAGNDCKYL